MRGKQISKSFIRIDRSYNVTQLHQNIATGKDGTHDTSGFFGNQGNGQHFE
jgi:hypothetical protein